MRDPAKTNRAFLALLGLVLLGSGLQVLAGGADVYRRWNLPPPADRPLITPHSTLVAASDQARWTEMNWWWPASIAPLLALLMLPALT